MRLGLDAYPELADCLNVDLVATFVEEPSPFVEILAVATDTVPSAPPRVARATTVFVDNGNVRNVCRVRNLANLSAKIDVLGIKEESLVESSDGRAQIGSQQ